MKFVGKVGIYSIYELEAKECKQHYRVYPTIVCWLSTHHEEIGHLNYSENETETIQEMIKWCNQYS